MDIFGGTFVMSTTEDSRFKGLPMKSLPPVWGEIERHFYGAREREDVSQLFFFQLFILVATQKSNGLSFSEIYAKL